MHDGRFISNGMRVEYYGIIGRLKADEEILRKNLQII